MMALLKFHGYKTYVDSGKPFRGWSFTRAINIPVEANEGEFLLDNGPDVKPSRRFQIRESSGDLETVRHLEPWQVAALFEGGIPEWNPSKAGETDQQREELRAIERIRQTIERLSVQFADMSRPPARQAQPEPAPSPEPDPEPEPRHPALARAIPDGPDLRRVPPYSAFELTEDIPAADLKAGTLLVWFYSVPSTRRERQTIKVPVRPISRSLFSAIAKHGDALRLIETSYPRNTDRECADVVKSMLRISKDPRAAKWNPKTTRLWIVPDLAEPVSEPITATSDEGAIFELLASVGCKMPPAKA